MKFQNSLTNAIATEDGFVIIEPPTLSTVKNLKDIWNYRHLLYYFCIRMIRLRYKDTVLGWLWLIIRPLLPVLIFTVIFARITKMPSEGVPYFLFSSAGMCLWNYFSNSLILITRSLRSNRRTIKKLYFPHLIIPIASIAPVMIELAVNIGLVFGIAGFYYLTQHAWYIDIRPELLVSLLFIVLTTLLSLGIGFYTSVLNVQARDVRFTLPFVLSMLLYITPIIYPLSSVPAKLRWAMALNPMAIIVEGFKWSILGTGDINILYVLYCCVIVCIIFFLGAWFFVKVENKLVDSL